jgi:hypothetical protein
MKKLVLTYLAFASLLGASMTVAPADPTPSRHLTTVSWVVQTRNEPAADGRLVTLIGRVTARTGNKYVFTDGTGFVHLSAEGMGLPMGPSLVVAGRIDHAFLGLGPVEVVVKNWHMGIVP